MESFVLIFKFHQCRVGKFINIYTTYIIAYAWKQILLNTEKYALLLCVWVCSLCDSFKLFSTCFMGMSSVRLTTCEIEFGAIDFQFVPSQYFSTKLHKFPISPGSLMIRLMNFRFSTAKIEPSILSRLPFLPNQLKVLPAACFAVARWNEMKKRRNRFQFIRHLTPCSFEPSDPYLQCASL